MKEGVFMPNYKNGRITEDIKREIAAELQKLKDPRLSSSLLTVVRTDVSGDMSHCKVYISSLEGIEKAKEACKLLEGAGGLIKHELSVRLKMKKCPELKFIPDNSIEHSSDITKLLREIEKPTGN